EALSEDAAGGDVGKLPAAGLGEERHRARGAGVDLDDVDVLLRVDDELYVVKADDADGQSQAAGVFEDRLLGPVAHREGGIDADGVAGVDARALDQLHDAGHEYFFSVADGVHFQFAADDVLIDQHRLLFVDLHGVFQVGAQHFLAGDDLHGAPTQHVAGAHQHRVADLRGHAHAFFDVGHGLATRLGDAEGLHHLFKGVAVLGLFDGLKVRADDAHAALHQR